MTTPLRLYDNTAHRFLIVDTDTGNVFADRNGDDRIDAFEEVRDPRALDAARELSANFSHFGHPVPGNKTADGRFEARGVLKNHEASTFAKGGTVAARRSELAMQLDYFDTDNDDVISLAEDIDGWRRLGWSTSGALARGLLQGVVFNRAQLASQVGVPTLVGGLAGGPLAAGGAAEVGTAVFALSGGFSIDIAGINDKRFKSTTHIYDDKGFLDHARLDEFLEAFPANGRMTQSELIDMVKRRTTPLGAVSARQFDTLFIVCEKINRGEKIVTKDQFRSFYEGSLLYLAASMTNASGVRP